MKVYVILVKGKPYSVYATKEEAHENAHYIFKNKPEVEVRAFNDTVSPALDPVTVKAIARTIPEHIFMDCKFDDCSTAEQKAFLRCAEAIRALIRWW